MALKSDKFGPKVLILKNRYFFLLDNDWFYFDEIGVIK